MIVTVWIIFNNRSTVVYCKDRTCLCLCEILSYSWLCCCF